MESKFVYLLIKITCFIILSLLAYKFLLLLLLWIFFLFLLKFYLKTVLIVFENIYNFDKNLKIS